MLNKIMTLCHKLFKIFTLLGFKLKNAAGWEQTNLGKPWSIKHEVLPNRTIWKHNTNMRGLSLVSYKTC